MERSWRAGRRRPRAQLRRKTRRCRKLRRPRLVRGDRYWPRMFARHDRLAAEIRPERRGRGAARAGCSWSQQPETHAALDLGHGLAIGWGRDCRHGLRQDFTKEKLAAGLPADVNGGPWLVRMQGLAPDRPIGGDRGRARAAGRRGLILRPRHAFSPIQSETNEAASPHARRPALHLVGKPDGQGRWQLRLWWKPFVTLIWLGGMLIALGGLLALIGRAWRATRSRRGTKERRPWRRERYA